LFLLVLEKFIYFIYSCYKVKILTNDIIMMIIHWFITSLKSIIRHSSLKKLVNSFFNLHIFRTVKDDKLIDKRLKIVYKENYRCLSHQI